MWKLIHILYLYRNVSIFLSSHWASSAFDLANERSAVSYVRASGENAECGRWAERLCQSALTSRCVFYELPCLLCLPWKVGPDGHQMKVC